MPAAGLTRRPWWARERPDRALVRAAGALAAVAVAVILVVAAVVWTLAPSSWQAWIAPVQRTDASLVTVVSIWTNNLLICCLPVLAGVLAHRLTARRRRWAARLVIAATAFAALRSLVIVGLVGGLDPAWLLTAAAWWIPEVTALSACCASAWLALRDGDSDDVSRRLAHALAFAGVLLGLAAIVEVALT